MATDEPTDDDADDSPLRATSEYESTPLEVYQRGIDNWIIGPLKILWSDYRGKTGLFIVLIYILMGTVGVVVWPKPSPGPPYMLSPFQSLRHPLGTQQSGLDLLGLMIHSTPRMFKMIIAGSIVGNLIGVTIGLVSGYSGGVLDKTLMTLTDTFGSIPGLPLLLILTALIQPQNAYLIGIILNLQGWTGLARALRSQVLPLRNKEYVEASKTMGQPTSNVFLKGILPELLPYIMIGFMGGATGIVQASVGLYFLGILPINHLNWGVVLNNARVSGGLLTLDAAHWLLVPLVTLTLLTFGLTLLAQAFDQVFNPRVRAQHLGRKSEGAEREEDKEKTGDTMSQVGGEL
ncbi:MAG: ABC transporter permease [Halobacteriaceae archaeon]